MNGTGELRQYEHHFRAMGTEVGAWLWRNDPQQAEAALRQVESFFARVEGSLSRFRAQSELSRMNRAAGSPFRATPMLFEVVEKALAWREASNGLFDPTILHALEVAGYDRDFALVNQDDAAGAAAAAAGERPATGAHVQLAKGHTITLPHGVGIDLGGIAKGWTVQEAVQRLGMWGPALVDAGGDIAAVGAPPQGAWVVTVAHPLEDEQEIAVLSLHEEAVATSSRVRRRWLAHGHAAHHLIDPRTGAPALTNLVSVTVTGARLPDVEIHAKVALILGEADGMAYLDALPGVSALMATEDGRYIMTGAFEERAYVSTSRFADRFIVA